jgi:hypothetical protein
MEISYKFMVAIVAFICGAINKAFINEIPNKYIPLQNVIIGIISGVVYYSVVPENLILSILNCIVVACSVGGAVDLKDLLKGDE